MAKIPLDRQRTAKNPPVKKHGGPGPTATAKNPTEAGKATAPPAEAPPTEAKKK